MYENYGKLKEYADLCYQSFNLDDEADEKKELFYKNLVEAFPNIEDEIYYLLTMTEKGVRSCLEYIYVHYATNILTRLTDYLEIKTIIADSSCINQDNSLWKIQKRTAIKELGIDNTSFSYKSVYVLNRTEESL